MLRRDYEIARFNVVAEVKRTFINFLSAGKKLELNREAHKIATLLATAVSDRVAAGAVSPIEETRAKVALAVSSADVEKWVREVETARRELAAAMGVATPTFDSPSGDLETLDVLSGTMNEQSRTVKARIVVPTSDGRLRPGMFVNIRVFLPGGGSVIAVPKAAVLSDEGRMFVFVHKEGG